MTLPDGTLEKWEYSRHTKVKHVIFSKYLTGWSKILGAYHTLNIFDCFAGRGRYKDGSEGSPLKIINILSNLKKYSGKPKNANLIFIEKNKNNYDNLCNEIKAVEIGDTSSSWLNIKLYKGEFRSIIDQSLAELNYNISPAFLFIDPFGFGGIPLKLIKKILSYPKTEAFITVMTRDLNRFLESPHHRASIEELFYCEDVANKISQAPYSTLKKDQALLRFYREQLHDIANVRYTFPFQVKDDKSLQTIYYLVHCTNHPKGCELMKAIMYKAGTPGRFGYLGPADGQLSLEIYFSVDKLADFLKKRFEGEILSFKEIRHKTLMETSFITKHYRAAIKKLEQEKKIVISGKGPRGGIKDTSRIDFRQRGILTFTETKKKDN